MGMQVGSGAPMRHRCKQRLFEVSAGRFSVVPCSQMLGIQSVIVLGNGLVLKLCSICVEVSAFMLPSQDPAPALKGIHGEMAGEVNTLISCIAADTRTATISTHTTAQKA